MYSRGKISNNFQEKIQRQRNAKGKLVDIGRTQTTLKVSDQVKGETFERGDRIKLYVVIPTNR